MSEQDLIQTKPNLSARLIVVATGALLAIPLYAASLPYSVDAVHAVDEEVVNDGSEDAGTLQLVTQIQNLFFLTDVAWPGAMWTFGNEAGAVRASLNVAVGGTEIFPDSIDRSGDPGGSWYYNELNWRKTYDKTTSVVRATILPSNVTLFAPLQGAPAASGADQPTAILEYAFEVCEVGDGAVKCAYGLHQTGVFQGYTDGGGPLSEGVQGVVGDETTEKYAEDGVVRNETTTFKYAGKHGKVTNFFRHVHVVPLGWIEGSQYEVGYQLLVYGGQLPDDVGYIDIYLADPLSGDGQGGGIELDTADPPASTSPSRRCFEIFDSGRYQENQDGTATDRYTGLMWQRCPVGYSLDDGATLADLSDDLCLPDLSPSASADWQAALQSAADDNLANYSNWRLPNVKELDTLVAQCLSPVIEHEVFPSTPTDAGYWTSTPNAGPAPIGPGDQAMQINFVGGDIQMADKASVGHARFVRDSGQAPIAPLPALSAARGAVREGDTGTTQLVMPVVLSSPSDQTATVDYLVRSPNDHAESGTDFEPSSGVLTLAPGQTQVNVTITVYGDPQVEVNELVYVELSNASSNVRLAVPTGVGTIVDDEPVISFGGRPVEVNEGAASDGGRLEIPLRLDRAGAVSISVDYEIATGTADVGSDVNGASGTVTFPAGQTARSISVSAIGDDVIENDEWFEIRLSDPVGAHLPRGTEDALVQRAYLINDDGPGTYAALNDTAIGNCATDVSALLACPQAGYEGQDAESGRDAEAANNADADGTLGFSLTKLDSVGNALPIQTDSYGSSPWACVEDNVTGLIWEVKAPDGDGGLHNADWTYTWFNSTGINDGGFPGTSNGGVCDDDANCDTEKFAAAVNATNLCGYNDWRVPTIEELYSIVDMSERTLTFDTRFFTNQTLSASQGAWSSTTHIDSRTGAATSAWQLKSSGMSPVDKGIRSASPKHVRLVRGGVQPPA